MESFSKIQNLPINTSGEEELYSSQHLNLIKFKSDEIIKESDSVAILPYFIEEGIILMLSEYLPAYQYRNKDVQSMKRITNYLSIITGKIEDGEPIEKAIRRELYEEGGILINNLYNITFNGPYFKTKRNTSYVYTCLLELKINDYKQIKPPTDGSYVEKLSRPIKISIGDINQLKINDLLTKNLILELKNNYNL